MTVIIGFVVDEIQSIRDGKSCVDLYIKEKSSKKTIVVSIFMQDYFYVEFFNTKHRADIVDVLTRDVNVEKDDDGEELISNVVQRKPHWSFQSECGKFRSIYGFQEREGSFLKIQCNSTFQTRETVKRLTTCKLSDIRLYESSLDYVAKFNATTGIAGCDLVSVLCHTPCSRQRPQFQNGIVHYESELDRIHVVHAGVEDFFDPVIMYYDIEVLTQDVNVFPTSDTCPIIQVSFVLNHDLGRGVFCVGETPGYTSLTTETMVLEQFVHYVNEMNPDVLCGYNSNGFDMPYLLDRMNKVQVKPCFSRSKRDLVTYKRERRESAQIGARMITTFHIPGRIMMDVCEILRTGSTTKLASYSLKNVCSEYLGDGFAKDDVRYRDIPDLMKTTDGRSKIAKYCLQDSVLVYELDKKLMISLNTWTLTRALGTAPRDTINRGLVFKLITKLKQYTNRYGFLIPSFTADQRPKFNKYPGALVLDPAIGFYNDPVVVLDFESLYPSEIRSANLSFDTLVTDKDWMEKNPDKWIMQIGVDEKGQPMKTGHAFVTSSTRVGLLPLIENELGKERSVAKAKMKTFPQGSRERFVYDGLQQAAKIVMNSLYGMLGSPTSMIPMVEIASTITALGRKHLMWAKTYVEENNTNCKVIYGDTDSIFIHMKGLDPEAAIEKGKELEKAIRENLFGNLKPMNMQYEKVFFPFLITRKKGYSGRMLKTGEKDWRVSTTGFANVKRDTAKVGVDTLNTFLENVLIKRDVELARCMVEKTIRSLFMGTMDMTNFKLTKKISKHMDGYKVIPPHIHAWQKMRLRIGNEAPVVGEMFDFVVIRGDRPQYIDYLLFTEEYHPSNIDYEYYFTRAIQSPLQEPLVAVYGKEIASSILDRTRYSLVMEFHANKNNLIPEGVSIVMTMTKRGNEKKKEHSQKSLLEMFGIKNVVVKKQKI